MDAASKPVPLWRPIALFLGLFALIAGYAVLIADFYHPTPATENVFEEPGDARKPHEEIYLEVLGVEPTRQALQVRLDFAARSGPHATHFTGSLAKNLFIEVDDGFDTEDIELRAGLPANSRTLALTLLGRLENYPLDHYDGQLRIRAAEGKAPGSPAVPLRLRTWEEIAGWDVAIKPADPAAGVEGLSLVLRAHRPSAHILFTALLYAAMILLAGSALTISGLVASGVRKAEATLTGTLCAIVFAVPALRNVLPGAPPIGVRADAFVFLWVQLAVIIGLTLFVATWARRGPRP